VGSPKGTLTMSARVAYMPLNTFPDAVSDTAALAAAGFAETLGCALHVTTFTVSIPQMHSPLGGFLINVPAMARAAEERSREEGHRLGTAIRNANRLTSLDIKQRKVVLGAALDAAALEARYFDVAVLPWSGETRTTQEDMTQSVIFGSGRPAIVVPPSVQLKAISHLAIAWDGSQVATRALWDALSFLHKDTHLTVLTVEDEKPISEKGMSLALKNSLTDRGYLAHVHELKLGSKSIAAALQDAALDAGATFLAMGGFGHSRFRDFVLGGATKGVLSDLRIPTLFSH
jgi:nucleotide-binding universal stress UspA family protein